MVTPQEMAQNAYPYSLKQNRTFRLSEGTGLLEVCNKSISRSSISRWHTKFMETRSVLDVVRSGRPRASAENIEKDKRLVVLL